MVNPKRLLISPSRYDLCRFDSCTLRQRNYTEAIMELKKYQVVFVDEYNNWWLVGFFDNLRDAEPQVNEFLNGQCGYDDEGCEVEHLAFGEDAPLGHLEEYPSSFGRCFDRIIEADVGVLEVRGFIFE